MFSVSILRALSCYTSNCQSSPSAYAGHLPYKPLLPLTIFSVSVCRILFPTDNVCSQYLQDTCRNILDLDLMSQSISARHESCLFSNDGISSQYLQNTNLLYSLLMMLTVNIYRMQTYYNLHSWHSQYIQDKNLLYYPLMTLTVNIYRTQTFYTPHWWQVSIIYDIQSQYKLLHTPLTMPWVSIINPLCFPLMS